tara:strand:- start:5224 stop:5856 length:633 start_codon:yes stop_codon:yes gene_type:complete
MSDILRQVDEDLRKDRLLRIWKLYRVYIVGFVLIALISLASYEYYLFNTKSKNEMIVQEYISAINSTDKNAAISQLIELDESSNAYIKGLAKLKRAELYFAAEKRDVALELLESISRDESLNEIIRDLALYKYLMLQLDILDKDLYIQIIDSKHLEGSKFKYHFKELKALKLLINGNQNDSIELFNSIIDNEDSPIDLKKRSEKFKKTLQ